MGKIKLKSIYRYFLKSSCGGNLTQLWFLTGVSLRLKVMIVMILAAVIAGSFVLLSTMIWQCWNSSVLSEFWKDYFIIHIFLSLWSLEISSMWSCNCLSMPHFRQNILSCLDVVFKSWCWHLIAVWSWTIASCLSVLVYSSTCSLLCMVWGWWSKPTYEKCLWITKRSVNCRRFYYCCGWHSHNHHILRVLTLA